MSKYINDEWFRYFEKILSIPKKTTWQDLWNNLYDNLLDDAWITIDNKYAYLYIVKQEKQYVIKDNTKNVFLVENNNTKEENYDILIKNAIQYIIDNKIIKKRKH
jgi:hypothetical protein